MSETKITKGWAGPKGMCDICGKRKAAYWFGDTSVALCGEQECADKNQASWDKMIEDTRYDE
jgi:hypothetical protein